jgi:HSP20 family protein
MADQTEQMARRTNGGAETESPQRPNLARWSPFAILEELQDELSRLWAPFSTGRATPSRPTAQLAVFGPRMDMFEKDGQLVIKMDLPGVKKDDVQVELDNGDLVIQGETRSESEVRDQHYYRIERSIGRFYRRVPLPFEVDPDRVEATLSDGVLEVRVPKPADTESSAKRIPVK